MITSNQAITEFSGNHRWVSNFASCQITTWGITYPSVEHAYQAAKADTAEWHTEFIGITAGQAKRLGNKVPLRTDWNEVKLQIMAELVKQKFNSEPYKSKLLATANKEIIEGNTWGDTYWGVCRNVGENHLGKIIMNIRNSL